MENCPHSDGYYPARVDEKLVVGKFEDDKFRDGKCQKKLWGGKVSARKIQEQEVWFLEVSNASMTWKIWIKIKKCSI